MDQNILAHIGRLTKDPEITKHNNNTIVNFSMALNSKYKENKRVDFFDYVVFGKLGEIISNHVVKGQQIGVAGKMRQERWKDKNTGKDRSKVVIHVTDMTFCGKKDDVQNGNQNPQETGQQQDMSAYY